MADTERHAPLPPLPLALFLLAVLHGLVDAFAAMIQPLWPDIQKSLALDEWGIQSAYLTWALANSVTQLAFGYWGDRIRIHSLLLWGGPALGILCMSLLGWAGSLVALIPMLLLGGLGIAGFHPEAAALAGACAPGDRSRALSIFALGGFLGQTVGPIYSGFLTKNNGLEVLSVSLVWGMLSLAVLALVMRKSAVEHSRAASAPAIPLRELLRGRVGSTVLLTVVGMLRIVPAAGVPLALAFVIKASGETNDFVGVTQAFFQGGIGVGSLACALFVRQARERRLLWQLPLPLAVAVLIMPYANKWVLFACMGTSGFLVGVTLPILIGYGQRMMPEGPRVATALTMGVTWGLGATAVSACMVVVKTLGHPEWAFPIFSACCVASSLLSLKLPDPATVGPIRRGARSTEPPAKLEEAPI